ncbi:DNA-binding transcriptional regulator, IclR family [Propionibacterium cyclohexanicum]|uniref:DNA-binding transcriptional regulator, IclR family n=1 Tax=Propionibacterium cyclohexanicum TaxID=64702 RepID=A0A1H9SNA5_9ACTN|nr:IclR family transcriptional regulator [Propionibacterium cyclohexanicum]SER86492.1 DNA-binding transcriptional regulator, IclR family [Propionibacterium cyclohexanicum]
MDVVAPRPPRNTANLLRILTYMASQAAPVSAQSIAIELTIPRSTVYELLGVLCEYGYAVALRPARRYALGARAFELSSAYSRQEPLARLSKVMLRRFVDRVGEAPHLAILQGSDVIYVAEERAPRRAPLVTEEGVRLPAYQTASGRAIMAWLPKEQVRAMIPRNQELPSRVAGRSPASFAALVRDLQEIRKCGYAIEVEEVTEGLASVVVPVFDLNDWPQAAFGVTFEIDRHPDVKQMVADVLPDIQRFAAELERRLGAQTSGGSRLGRPGASHRI